MRDAYGPKLSLLRQVGRQMRSLKDNPKHPSHLPMQVTNVTRLPLSGTVSSSTLLSTSTAAAPVILVITLPIASLGTAVLQGAAPALNVTVLAAAYPGPPNITLTGASYVQILESSIYTDAGAVAFDTIDAYAMKVSTAIQLCTWPTARNAILPGGGQPALTVKTAGSLTCAGSFAAVPTSANNVLQAYVLTYR